MKKLLSLGFALLIFKAHAQIIEKRTEKLGYGTAIYTYRTDPTGMEIKEGNFAYTQNSVNEAGGKLEEKITGQFKNGWRVGNWTYTCTYKDFLTGANDVIEDAMQTGKMTMTSSYVNGYPDGIWTYSNSYKERYGHLNILGQIVWGPYHDGGHHNVTTKWKKGMLLSYTYNAGKSTDDPPTADLLWSIYNNGFLHYTDIGGDRIVVVGTFGNDISGLKIVSNPAWKIEQKKDEKKAIEEYRATHVNDPLPFIGTKAFNFFGGNGTGETITIDEYRNVTIATDPCCGDSSKVEYSGKYAGGMVMTQNGTVYEFDGRGISLRKYEGNTWNFQGGCSPVGAQVGDGGLCIFRW